VTQFKCDYMLNGASYTARLADELHVPIESGLALSGCLIRVSTCRLIANMSASCPCGQ